MRNQILQGDALEVLKTLESESVDCVITSPPYWGLRDYGTGKWIGGDENCDHKKNPPAFSNKAMAKSTIGAYANTGHAQEGYLDVCKKCGAKRKDEQLGLEPDFRDYISRLCDIFDEVKRVLKNEGTCWVNLGDTYSAQRWTGNGKGQPMNKMKDGHRDIAPEKITGMPDKTLIQIPSRFAIEMTNRGWILRNEIVWHKPNCMPSSVKDRFTVDFEKVFFFVKQQKYWFETQYEPHQRNWGDENWTKKKESKTAKENSMIANHHGDKTISETFNPLGRNKRTVWRISPKPFKEAHFAVFPEALVEIPIKAGCPPGGVVLDPFMGAGTTALVAQKLNRNYLGIELNPEYIKIAEKRLNQLVLI